MKKIFFLLFVALLGNWASAQITDYSVFDKKFNFYVANDLGRNGYYDQKPIAELMGVMAENGTDPEFVLAAGDVHHFEGVRSVNAHNGEGLSTMLRDLFFMLLNYFITIFSVFSR